MSVIVRFAPSPTGRLTFGNLRAPIFNWLYAKSRGGQFMLRIDDTDSQRSTKELDDAIQSDLRWLGFEWDIFARQSERFDRYEAAKQQLRAAGRLYPCYETEEELGLKRKSLLARGLPPVYDRAALKLSDADRARLEAEGRRPHWRFLMKDEPVQWLDGIRGQVTIPVHDLSDPVLIREDGSLLYTLASCVDDLDFNITDIIRGEDHVTNSAAQIQIMQALDPNKPTPRFAHFPHITGKDGEKLSKRLGSLGVPHLRDEMKVEPEAVWAILGRLGTADPVDPDLTREQLVAAFDLGRISRSPAKFDPDDLQRINARVLHAMPWKVAQPRLKALGLDADEAFWLAVRSNISHMAEAQEWWRIARASLAGIIDDGAFTAQAAALLPPEPWSVETWNTWVDAVKAGTGRKGKELFMPLRRALTAMDHGPELKALLPLLGRARAISRLTGKVA